jgi:ATP-dependent protease HslVU (ClpYQ) ATPase subunit
MWQEAVPVSGSTSRKLAQPLVPQKRRFAAVAVWVRRRIRRMAADRPVTDEVVERVIMVCLLELSGAP